MPANSSGEANVARKNQELRPVMTRIPERLRGRLEREANSRGRSMNAEIVKRLQESFDIPEQAEAIVHDVSSEVESAVDNAVFPIMKRLDELQSEIHTILARLESMVPASQLAKEEAERQRAKAEEEARKAEEEARRTAALEEAIRTIERAGFKIARLKDEGEKK